MNKYFSYFKKRLNELDEKKIDHAYLKSEEFAEMFAQGADQAAKSATEARIKRFANILANQTLINSKSRQRTLGIFSFVDRISDMDTLVLVSYGDPRDISMRAKTKDDVFIFVNKLVKYLGINVPTKEDIVDSIIYMDNLGLLWVNENNPDIETEKGELLILKEFSSFRTPLGSEVLKAIIPQKFFIPKNKRNPDKAWPLNAINPEFKKDLFF